MDLVRIVSSFVLLILGLTLAVCATPGTLGLPDGPPTARGTLAHIQHGATASGILVEPAGDACGLQATVDAGTRYFRREASGRLALLGRGAEGVRALTDGGIVSVWVAGPVQDSCPSQGRAAAVAVEMPAPDPGVLVGQWVHAAEEDAGDVEVYRPEGSRPFPPRMYRQRYALFEGGRAEALVPHPADAHVVAEGAWSLTPDGVLVVRYGGQTDRLRLVEATPEVLRILREN